MNILVVGRGWTGKKVFKELLNRGHVVAFASHKNAIEAVSQGNYTTVVNCAGVTGSPNVDACELDRVGTVQGNAAFPILLQETCEMYGTYLAHFSSGCIYQGQITDVNADPNYFGSIYSVSKGVSDLYLKDRALVFRIRMPFTGVNEPKNYLTKVYNYAKKAKLIDAGQNSLTDLDEAVRVACDLIEDRSATGPFNLVNQGSVDMHTLAQIMGIQPEWFTEEEFRSVTAAGRSTCTIPAYEGMSNVISALEAAVHKMKNG
jgi:dTDP-4-dehydrorhamnose reductase